jgi:hypothetical protein
MENFEVLDIGQDKYIINIDRHFRMRIDKSESDEIEENKAYFVALFHPFDSTAQRQKFEIDVSEDPEFDKWDMDLFQDAIDFYCLEHLGNREYLIQIPNNPNLYPYEPDEIYPDDGKIDDPNEVLPF